MVQFALGWAHSDGMTLFFTGDIERAVRVDGQQRRLFCREISARLDSNIPLAIRHATLKDVLGAFAAATGLSSSCRINRMPRSKRRPFTGTAAAFTGWPARATSSALPTTTGRPRAMAKYLWAPGLIHAGQTGPAQSRKNFSPLPGSAARKIAAVPTMRPGAVLNGQRIRMVRFSGHSMTVGFEDV